MANIYDMSDTWNDAGTTFTAIKMDVTDTASDADSLLMDLQVGGASEFNVRKDGRTSWGGSNAYFMFNVAGAPSLFNSSTSRHFLGFSYNSLKFASDLELYWTNAAGNAYGTGDLYLGRDAADTLAQRRSTNAQTFNLYNTYTDASNYERLSIGLGIVAANVYSIQPQKSGTGINREFWLRGANLQYIRFKTDGTTDFGADTGGVNFTVTRDTIKFLKTMLLVYDETVATLPASPSVGMISRVTDGDSGLTFGNTVVNSGAGATPYLVWYNGTNWTVIGA